MPRPSYNTIHQRWLIPPRVIPRRCVAPCWAEWCKQMLTNQMIQSDWVTRKFSQTHSWVFWFSSTDMKLIASIIDHFSCRPWSVFAFREYCCTHISIDRNISSLAQFCPRAAGALSRISTEIIWRGHESMAYWSGSCLSCRLLFKLFRLRYCIAEIWRCQSGLWEGFWQTSE